MINLKNLLFLIILSTFFMACSSENENKLKEMGIPFTEDAYFEYGVEKNNIVVLELFFKAGIDPNLKKKTSALQQSLETGNIKLLKLLIEKYNVNIDYNNVINYIVTGMSKHRLNYNNRTEIMTYLFAHGAKISEKTKKLLLTKYQDILFNYDFLDYLLKYNKLSQEELDNLLVETVNLEYLDAFKKLIHNGANINNENVKKAFKQLVYNSNNIRFLEIGIENNFIDFSKPEDGGVLLSLMKNFDFFADNSEKKLIKFILQNGANPLLKLKQKLKFGIHEYYAPNAIDLFCTKSPAPISFYRVERQKDYFPEVCKDRQNSEKFKEIFLN